MFQKVIDGKKIIVKGNSKNIPPIKTIKEAYAKLPDNKRIPVVFETREQYLDEYIKNQEKAKKTTFKPQQIKDYKHKELANMSNIVSRYTTDHNPFIDRRVVFFNDKKIPANQFKDSVVHEYGHELWEKSPKIRRDWRSVPKSTAPTTYGKTAKQEDFSESLMLSSKGQLQDPVRNRILQKNGPIIDNTSKQSVKDEIGGEQYPPEIEFSTQFKTMGLPKKYYPREITNLREKVWAVTDNVRGNPSNVQAIALSNFNIPSFSEMVAVDRTALSRKALPRTDYAANRLVLTWDGEDPQITNTGGTIVNRKEVRNIVKQIMVKQKETDQDYAKDLHKDIWADVEQDNKALKR